jgi:O-antigen/teichoic acid export membrane protein
MAVGTLFGFIVPPLIVPALGMARFGVWAFVSVLTGFLGMMGFGMNTAFIKHISLHHNRNETNGVNEVVNTAIFFYLALSAVMLPVLYFSMRLILRLFKVPAQLADEAFFIFMLGTATFFFSLTFNVFSSGLVALQRIDITNMLMIFHMGINFTGIVISVQRGYGLRGLIISQGIATFIFVIANYFIARRMIPGIRVHPRYFRPDRLKELMVFGLKMLVGHISSIVTTQTDKIVIVYFLGLNYVGQFQLGCQLVDRVRTQMINVDYVLLSAVAEMDARNENDKIKKLYVSSSKFVALMSFPIMVFLFFFAGTIMIFWMKNSGLDKAVLTIRLLAPGMLASMVTVAAINVLVGMGRPGLVSRMAASYAVANVALTLILVRFFGYAGIVGATSIAFIAIMPIVFLWANRILDVSHYDFVTRVFLKPGIVSIAMGALLYFVARRMGVLHMYTGRLPNFAVLSIAAVIYFGIYFIALIKWNYLDAFERGLLRSKLRIPL